jgi:hypothetical protein
MDFYSMYCIDCAWNAYKRLRATGFRNEHTSACAAGRLGNDQTPSETNVSERAKGRETVLATASEETPGEFTASGFYNRFALSVEGSQSLGNVGIARAVALECQAADEEFEMQVLQSQN